MKHDARMAALALQVLGEATLNLKGKDVPTYVAVHNWLEEMRTASDQSQNEEPDYGVSEELSDAERQTTQG